MKPTVFVLIILFLGIVILPHSGTKTSENRQETEWQCKVPAREVSLKKTVETPSNKDLKAPVNYEFSGKHANTVFFIL